MALAPSVHEDGTVEDSNKKRPSKIQKLDNSNSDSNQEETDDDMVIDAETLEAMNLELENYDGTEFETFFNTEFKEILAATAVAEGAGVDPKAKPPPATKQETTIHVTDYERKIPCPGWRGQSEERCVGNGHYEFVIEEEKWNHWAIMQCNQCKKLARYCLLCDYPFPIGSHSMNIKNKKLRGKERINDHPGMENNGPAQ
ncbi:predicted protein [Chaetoceros tenuissimus]|uniref:Uncharacterized protein n=1 Tax=Chaetoceros tenuissimus TaxID=426638 RepID=A0AAD3D9L7_9STRA|nr:predicted protein [Chaetoceros tenuissimus]